MSDNKIHSKIGASSMYRWQACPGSVRLSEGIESVSSSYADEGTKAHQAAYVLLKNVPSIFDNKEMETAVRLYVDLITEESEGCETLIEHKFDLSSIHPGLYGTADAVIYNPRTKLLRVYDFKYGQGIIVEAENNSQLMYYGLGALLSTASRCKTIELVIVQPRANHVDGPVRRWRFDSIDILEFASDLKSAAQKTTDPQAPLIPGNHCRFCPASGICPELHKKALDIAQTEFSPALSYDPKKLSETLEKVDMLEGYAKSVREFAYREIEHGRTIPGWKLVEKRPVRKWKDELLAAEELKCIFSNQEHYKEIELRSPAQVEKLMPKDSRYRLDKLTESVSSGLTLVPETDKRPSKLTNIQNDFDVITD